MGEKIGGGGGGGSSGQMWEGGWHQRAAPTQQPLTK